MRVFILVFVFFSVFFNGYCSQKERMGNLKQSVSDEVFSPQELQLLYKLVNIFDQIVCERDCSDGYRKAYANYIDSLRISDLSNLSRDFSETTTIDQLNLVIGKLKKNALFSEIWKKDEMLRLSGAPRKPFSRDSVITWNINTRGKYAEFLTQLGRTYPAIEEYHLTLSRVGGVAGSGGTAIMLERNENTLNFDDKSVRLVFAIHWITYLTESDQSFISKLEE